MWKVEPQTLIEIEPYDKDKLNDATFKDPVVGLHASQDQVIEAPTGHIASAPWPALRCTSRQESGAKVTTCGNHANQRLMTF